jgi:DnaA family protein
VTVSPRSYGQPMKQIALDIGMGDVALFENFLAGPNEAALAHLRLWTTSTTRSPVPTYLWGPEGSGRTHLLTAAGEALRSQGARVGWMDAGMPEPPDFEETWTAVLLDDVDRYSAVQQQVAFNWFVNAQTHQRWLLAAGSVPPADLPLREDLRTRLGWGHVFGLQVLTEAERRAVLRKAADARGIFLGDEVMDYMLSRFSRDLGSLMQLLGRMDQYALVNKRAVTVPLLKSMLDEG